ncbi:MAG TPA: N-acetylmuramoyl-L-alanine amidase [bacterium]|jgi:N-acetylmuramoyl-L-alanine amidase|nr:N-acetylmuramoyl-L-alanine amidase [bacterium]
MATVCLDPGHGGRDPGAVREGLKEKHLTLAIAEAAGAALRPRHHVVLTRTADRALTLAERRSVADRTRADLFVSIHVNASTNTRAAGIEVFTRSPAHESSIILAGAILRAVMRRFPQRPNRGVRQRGLGVLRQARPAALVECFFLSNPTERALLAQSSTQTNLGRAIAAGCEAALAPPALTARRCPARVAADRERTARRAARSPRPPAARPA